VTLEGCTNHLDEPGSGEDKLAKHTVINQYGLQPRAHCDIIACGPHGLLQKEVRLFCPPGDRRPLVQALHRCLGGDPNNVKDFCDTDVVLTIETWLEGQSSLLLVRQAALTHAGKDCAGSNLNDDVDPRAGRSDHALLESYRLQHVLRPILWGCHRSSRVQTGHVGDQLGSCTRNIQGDGGEQLLQIFCHVAHQWRMERVRHLELRMPYLHATQDLQHDLVGACYDRKLRSVHRRNGDSCLPRDCFLNGLLWGKDSHHHSTSRLLLHQASALSHHEQSVLQREHP